MSWSFLALPTSTLKLFCSGITEPIEIPKMEITTMNPTYILTLIKFSFTLIDDEITLVRNS